MKNQLYAFWFIYPNLTLNPKMFQIGSNEHHDETICMISFIISFLFVRKISGSTQLIIFFVNILVVYSNLFPHVRVENKIFNLSPNGIPNIIYRFQTG